MNNIEDMGSHVNNHNDIHSHSCPRNILISALGIVILLIGMWITSLFSDGVINSIINTFVLCLSIAIVIKYTKIESIIGSKVTLVSIILISLFTLLNIWLSASYIFKDYLNGASISLSGHYEHSLMFSEMSTIATGLKSGMTLQQATYGLPLYQYYNIFVYSSFMFLLGGINATNMCIWNAMHMALCPIFMVLILDKFGVKDNKKLKVSYFVSMLQPLFLSYNSYNKVILGEALVLIAVYIYISNYTNPIKNMICFPLYAYLLWTVRVQYIILAAVMFVVCLIHNKLSKKILVPVIIALVAVLVLFSRIGFGQLYQNLNIWRYHEGHDLSISSIPARVIRSFLPYFPLSNIFDDQYWYFNIFCILQEIMNITLWYLVFVNHGKINISRTKKTIRNPLIIIAFILLLSGTFSELHTTYLSVGTMFLVSELDDVSCTRVSSIYVFIAALVVVFNILYVVLGLQGSGIAGVRFA